MKRIYEFISKANQVLLFLAALMAITAMSYSLYSDFTRRYGRYESTHVAIVEPNDQTIATSIQDVRFLGSSRDFVLFGIVKHGIKSKMGNWGQSALASSVANSARADYGAGEIVNIVFCRKGRKIRNLFENDGLVLTSHLGEIGASKLEAFVFTTVTEDTDNNRRLDDQDRQDLYIVDKDLTKPDMVIKGVIDFEVLSPTRLVVKMRGGDPARFLEVDIEAQKTSEIQWK
jgi:hypothetical protein